MKKFLILVLTTITFTTQQIFATPLMQGDGVTPSTTQTTNEQTFVVLELFSWTGCHNATQARAVLATMTGNQGQFPYLIPLLWQIDGSNRSPQQGERRTFYGVTHTPTARFGGSIHLVGLFADLLQRYTAHYNTVAQRQAPIKMTVDYEIIDNQIKVISDVELISNITTTDNKIFFVLTYDWGAAQPGNYDASIVAVNDQAFALTTSGQSGTFEHTFTLNSAWDLRRIRIVSFVQTTAGNLAIHQAATRRVGDQSTYISIFEQEATLNVFPNPVLDGRLVVETPENTQSTVVRIYDVSGRLVLTHAADRQRAEIDISHLPNGAYIVRMGQNIARIIKQ